MRSKRSKKRPISTDPIYKSRIVTRLINNIMLGGEKSISEGIVYGALEKLSADRKEAATMLEQAIKNAMPKQEVRSRRVGGATYQIPYPLKHDRAEALAIRWIIKSARKKKGKSMVDRLCDEIKNTFEGAGDTIKKRDDTHKMAESNRAFAHFRF